MKPVGVGVTNGYLSLRSSLDRLTTGSKLLKSLATKGVEATKSGAKYAGQQWDGMSVKQRQNTAMSASVASGLLLLGAGQKSGSGILAEFGASLAGESAAMMLGLNLAPKT